MLREAEADPAAPTWRAKVQSLPDLDSAGLRPAPIEAVHGIQRSLAEQPHDRSLVQMATGAGKTFTAVTKSYRLLKHAGFTRILVDRNNLGDQTLREFRDYTTPDDGRKFTDLYNVDKLTGAGMVGSSKVVISTLQRVHAALRGQEVADTDDPGLDSFVPEAPRQRDTSPRRIAPRAESSGGGGQDDQAQAHLVAGPVAPDDIAGRQFLQRGHEFAQGGVVSAGDS